VTDQKREKQQEPEEDERVEDLDVPGDASDKVIGGLAPLVVYPYRLASASAQTSG
jgi:hypothetical protein